jgi:hypothetical protein
MRSYRGFRLLAPLAASLTIGAHSAPFKDVIGVYAIVDRVVMEPTETGAERIQVWGQFRIARTITVENGKIMSIDLSAFHPTQRGYLYYTVNRTDESETRAEWNQLKAAAGNGREFAFGSRIPNTVAGLPQSSLHDSAVQQQWERYNGRVRLASEPVAQPDTFPLRYRVPARR